MDCGFRVAVFEFLGWCFMVVWFLICYVLADFVGENGFCDFVAFGF